MGCTLTFVDVIQECFLKTKERNVYRATTVTASQSLSRPPVASKPPSPSSSNFPEIRCGKTTHLTHGREEADSVQINSHLGVALLLPLVILYDVEKATRKVQDPLLWVVLNKETGPAPLLKHSGFGPVNDFRAVEMSLSFATLIPGSFISRSRPCVFGDWDRELKKAWEPDCTAWRLWCPQDKGLPSGFRRQG